MEGRRRSLLEINYSKKKLSSSLTASPSFRCANAVWRVDVRILLSRRILYGAPRR
jgi:hypothetical protein